MACFICLPDVWYQLYNISFQTKCRQWVLPVRCISMPFGVCRLHILELNNFQSQKCQRIFSRTHKHIS
jgi:hypothetical protein